jgi:nicotinamidase-related amidase
LGIRTVILTGTTTPNCIRTTCYDGLSLDYNTLIIEDCCSSNTEEIQRVNMEDMERVGAVRVMSAAFLAEESSVEDLAGDIQKRVQADETAPE